MNQSSLVIVHLT